jgi:hypothetical protein
MFEDLFAKSPNLHAEVITNIVYENKVVLHEYVYGRNGSTERIEQLIIFEIKNEKIEVMYRA